MNVLVVGEGPLIRSVIDMLQKIGTHTVTDIVALDSSPTGSYSDVAITGRIEDMERMIEETGIRRIIVGIEDIGTRMNITQRIGRITPEVEFVSVIHPSAVLGSSIQVGAGSLILAGAVIEVGTSIGEHTMIGPNVSIGVDCVMGNFVTIGPGAVLGHGCHVGSGSAVGANAALINHIIIGTHSVVGPGAAVVEHVPDLHVAASAPARTIRTRLVGERYP